MALKINVTGKSIESLMGLSNKELSDLSRSNLSKVVSRLASAANKRIKRFGQETSPALEKVKRTGGNFSVRGKSADELKKEFLRVKDFLQSETSTKSGAKKVKKNVINSLKKKGVSITEKQYDKFFRVYERLKEQDPSINDKLLKYNVMSEITEEIGNDIDTITENIINRLSDIYEEQAEHDDFSRFFKLE